MTINRVNSNGWPANGTTSAGWLTSTQLNAIDTDHVNGVDRINGDTIAGAIALTGTAASITSPLTTITGAGSVLQTASGGRIVLGDNDYPQYSAARTFQRCQPFLVQQGANLNWIIDVDGSTANGATGLVGTVDLSRFLTDGSILTAIDVYFYVGASHSAPPAVMPSFTLNQKGTSLGILPIVTASIPNPGTGSAWYASGGIQNFTLIVPSLTVDRAGGTYYLVVTDESGAGALTGNIYQSLRLTFTRTDMRPA